MFWNWTWINISYEIKNIALNINKYWNYIFFNLIGSVRPDMIFEDIEPNPKLVQTGSVRFWPVIDFLFNSIFFPFFQCGSARISVLPVWMPPLKKLKHPHTWSQLWKTSLSARTSALARGFVFKKIKIYFRIKKYNR